MRYGCGGPGALAGLAPDLLIGKTPSTATPRDWLHALAYSVRDRMVERMMTAIHGYYEAGAKRVYYLSLEHLLGHQYMRCRNSQPAMLSAIRAISARGHICPTSRERPAPSRNTARRMTRK